MLEEIVRLELLPGYLLYLKAEILEEYVQHLKTIFSCRNIMKNV